MPQLDLYIWFSSVANFLSFFFLFYFFLIEFLLVNIARVNYIKWGFLDLVNYISKYTPKLNYILDNGLFANIYISFFSKKSTLLKLYNQLMSVYIKNLKLFVYIFFINAFSVNEVFFKQYNFNFFKGNLYLNSSFKKLS